MKPSGLLKMIFSSLNWEKVREFCAKTVFNGLKCKIQITLLARKVSRVMKGLLQSPSDCYFVKLISTSIVRISSIPSLLRSYGAVSDT